MSVNKVTLLGNIGGDPETRRMQNGDPVVNFSLATSERWTDKNSGEKKERTQWHRIVVFDKGLAGMIEKYLRKGDKVYLEGQLETRKWQDQSGQDRYSTEVVLRPFRSMIDIQRCKAFENNSGGSRSTQPTSSHVPQDMDDEIPF